MIEKLRNKPWIIYLSGFLLLIAALLISLGKVNIFFAVDEATRALVALEMMISENFVTPTINGEFYYNKPPLFSWILVVFFKAFGMSEFVLRLPTVISLVGFGFTIYYFVSREMGKQVGIITAFLFVTSGRLLFWESLLGYIDTTFSWVVYSSMMFTIYYFRQKKYLHLFIISYFFMTIGYMLKGLPAIAFQGMTLLVVFVFEGEFKRLFSWKHLLGGMVFVLLAGSYYFVYYQYNSLQAAFESIWEQSARRMVLEEDQVFSMNYLFRFPFDMFYHYLPWTILIVFLFIKGFWQTLFKNQFLKLNFLIVAFNIIPYWLSSEMYPKYIMMLIPLMLTVCVFFYLQSKNSNGKVVGIIETIFLIAAIMLSVAYLTLPFIQPFSEVHLVFVKSFLLFGFTAFVSYLFFKIKTQRLILFAIILIIGRIALGWFIWPQRVAEFVQFEKDAQTVAQISEDENLFYYHAEMSQYAASYVMSREKQSIVRIENEAPKPGIFYITDDEGLSMIGQQHDSVEVYYAYPNVQDGRNLSLIKIIE